MPDRTIILNVLKSSGAHSFETALNPKRLIEKCTASGSASPQDIETALVSLIDEDLVDYEMDANTDVTHIWLL